MDSLNRNLKQNIYQNSNITEYQKLINYFLNFEFDGFINLLGTAYKNAPSYTEPNNIVFYFNISFENRLNIRKVIILHTYYYNEFGNRFYFDTTNVIINDRWDFNNKLLLPFGNKKVSASLSINTTSQYRKNYDYRYNENGEIERYIYTCSGSPKYTIYSGGINYDFFDRSSINVSLASAKRTVIKNSKLFDYRETDFLYGVEKGKKKLVVYGFNATLQISRQKIFKNFYIENYTETFTEGKKHQALKYTTVDII